MAVVVDGRGLVTVAGEQASVREILTVLSRWYELPALNLEAILDSPRAFRIEQVPIPEVVTHLLASVGHTGVRIPARPARRNRGRPSIFLMMVHDGQGAVTVSAEQASTREVLNLLSRWFHFPILNPETIPDTRRSMQFLRMPVAQLVDALLHGAGINYVILSNPGTLVPSKVVAAPLSASTGNQDPRGRGMTATPGVNSVPGYPGAPTPADIMPPMPQDQMPPMPPIEGATPGIMPPVEPMPSFPPDPPLLPRDMMPPVQPPGPGSAPATSPVPAPGAAKPGLIVPVPVPPGIKPPGDPRG